MLANSGLRLSLWKPSLNGTVAVLNGTVAVLNGTVAVLNGAVAVY